MENRTYRLELNEVVVRADHPTTLCQFNFQLPTGYRGALFGGAASGKSLILKIANGQIKLISGSVKVNGRIGLRGRRIALAGPDFRCANRLTVSQLLLLRAASRLSHSERPHARVAEMLELLDLFPVRDTIILHLTHTQRLALNLAAALVSRPDVILIDDMMMGLPEPIRFRVDGWLNERCAEDQICILEATTHHERAVTADRVFMLHRCQILADDSPAKLLATVQPTRLTLSRVDADWLADRVPPESLVMVREREGDIEVETFEAERVVSSLLGEHLGGPAMVLVSQPTLWDVLSPLASLADMERENGAG